MELNYQQDEVWQTPPDQFFAASPNLLSAERTTSLYQAALKGNWKVAKRIIDAYPDMITAGITKHGDTALHIAAAAMHRKLVQKLVSKMTPEDLAIRNKKRNTALCLAALTGDVSIAKAMVDKNRGLPRIRCHSNLTPLQIAAVLGHRDMVKYLFKFHYTTGLSRSDLMDLFTHTVNIDLYDVAVKILECYPYLVTARDDHQQTLLQILARRSRKSSIAQQSLWRRFCNFFTFVHTVEEDDSLPPAAIKLVEHLCKGLLMKPKDEALKLIKEPTNLLFEAAQAGNAEFLRILVRSYPDLVWEYDNNGRTIFHIAVEYRQEKVFRLIHELGAIKGLLTFAVDPRSNDNILHLAARLPSSDILNHTPGAAFQMQSELQWFKAVRDLVKLEYAENINLKGEKPRALFTEEHNSLREKGETWMRSTASSYSVVATLIVTTVFSAGSKLLGGNDIKHYKEYFVFAILDAISLVYSTASILMFLSIMTSRYAEDDFDESLPNKLLIGLILLVVAIATMMMAFFTIFYITFSSHLYFVWIVLLGMPGLLMIVIFLLRDSIFLVFRLMAKRNVLCQPMHPRLLEEVEYSNAWPIAADSASNLV